MVAVSSTWKPFGVASTTAARASLLIASAASAAIIHVRI
jgi:hypothetical protein